MSVLIKGMEMPTVCITEDGWFGNCPMDRTWCQQRFAPPETTTGEAYKACLGKLPKWCPLTPAQEPPKEDMLSHEIVVKGNCVACGKPLGENDGLFLCAECQNKNKEEE